MDQKRSKELGLRKVVQCAYRLPAREAYTALRTVHRKGYGWYQGTERI